MSHLNRRTERIASGIRVSIMRGGVLKPAIVADVNEHGLFIATQCSVEPGELIKVVIELPDGPLTACVVVRFVGRTSAGQGLGTEFLCVGESEMRRWSRYYRGLLAQRKTILREQMAVAV